MFLDTSGLMCLFDARDSRPSSAVDWYDLVQRRVTTNYVLAEFVALTIARRAPLPTALQFVNALSNSSEVEVIWVDKELHDRGMSLLIQRGDKLWSLCDAISFVVMDEFRLQSALTTDHHFEQAGYRRLLDEQ